jgi:hypothetical protein
MPVLLLLYTEGKALYHQLTGPASASALCLSTLGVVCDSLLDQQPVGC